MNFMSKFIVSALFLICTMLQSMERDNGKQRLIEQDSTMYESPYTRLGEQLLEKIAAFNSLVETNNNDNTYLYSEWMKIELQKLIKQHKQYDDLEYFQKEEKKFCISKKYPSQKLWNKHIKRMKKSKDWNIKIRNEGNLQDFRAELLWPIYQEMSKERFEWHSTNIAKVKRKSGFEQL